MKESVLWRRLDRAVGTRLRARYKNKESGVAMVMALMFILVVLLTSTLLLGILLSQALPYRNNSRNAQGKVAAEAGLQAGLSFLRTAESYYETGNYDKLMPATAADPSKTSLDETYAVETATASSSATGTAKVVTLNYVPVNDTTSGTTAVSTSSSTHDQKLSYRIQIGYYDGDPNAGGKLVADTTKLSTVKYAVVVSYGYVNRYPDGRAAGTENDPVRTAAALYKFGQAKENPGGDGGGGSPMRNKPMEDNGSPWIVVSSYKRDANGDLDEIVSENNVNDNGLLWGDHLKKAVPDPRNDLCFVATTDAKGNIDPNKSAIDGSAVRVFRKAVQVGSTNTFKYSDYCKKNGAYRRLNQWVYGKDDSIRLASDKSLCMTGVDITHRSVKGGIGKDGVIRLTTCGSSYSPAVSDGKIVPGVGNTWDDQGYDTSAELADANSLLKKYQKWGFYYGFVNAGYVNFPKNGSANQNEPQYSVGPIRGSGSDYQHTLFQTMYAQRIASADITPNAKWGQCDADVSSTQYGDNSIGGNACFLASSQWVESFPDKGSKVGMTFAESLGAGGESGWNTNQIVSNSGACMQAWNNGTEVGTKQCNVNAAPSYSYCYGTLMNGTGNLGSDGQGSWTYPCPVASTGTNWKVDSIWYDRGQDATSTSVGRKLTTIVSYWAQSGYRPYSNGDLKVKCYYVNSATVGEVLRNKEGACPLDISNTNTFYRYEYVGKDSIFNYKFVLASTADTSTPLCLTEMTNGIEGYTYINEPGTTGLANDYFNHLGRYTPMVVLQKCTKSSTNALGETLYPQQWNGPIVVPTPGPGTASYTPEVKASISYASSKYVDAANWKW